MTCSGQANLDRLTANAAKADAADKELGIQRVWPRMESFRYLDPKDDYYRDAEDGE